LGNTLAFAGVDPATRTGLPALLTVLATTGVVLSLLGLAGDSGTPERVLLVRANSGGGSAYGPFVNANHFAQAIELTLPAALVLASSRLPVVRDGFSDLLIVEGIEGNTRWGLWRGRLHSWYRSPLLGSGLGSYRHVIGMDKPATGDQTLEQAHSDWLEWLATGGIVGAVANLLVVAGLARQLEPRGVRRLHHGFRYALAGASLAFVATALHEAVGFGFQTPLNRYLLAAWIGRAWGAERFGTRHNFEEHT
jgi:hypothetical protein